MLAGVLGLTTIESSGFLPEPDTPEPSWVGKREDNIPASVYGKHLRTFRERVRVNYRWLIQADEKHFAWNMVDLHPIVVVGRDGKSVFAQVSGGEISSVHAVVNRLLAEK